MFETVPAGPILHAPRVFKSRLKPLHICDTIDISLGFDSHFGMMAFPPPPKMTNRGRINPQGDQIPTGTDPLTAAEGLQAGPNGAVSEESVSYILRTTLIPEHRDDPNVIRFISNYLRCRDAAQAAREAGLTARSGLNLRNRPDIFKAITALTEQSVMKYGFDAAEIIEKVKEVAAIDPIEFINPDGSYRKMHEMEPEARRAIKKLKVRNIFEKDPNGMKVVVGEIIEIELWDKLKAAELLGREKNTFKETKVVVNDVTSNMAAVLLESKARAEESRRQLQEGLSRSRDVIEITGTVQTPETVTNE